MYGLLRVVCRVLPFVRWRFVVGCGLLVVSIVVVSCLIIVACVLL